MDKINKIILSIILLCLCVIFIYVVSTTYKNPNSNNSKIKTVFPQDKKTVWEITLLDIRPYKVYYAELSSVPQFGKYAKYNTNVRWYPTSQLLEVTEPFLVYNGDFMIRQKLVDKNWEIPPP